MRSDTPRLTRSGGGCQDPQSGRSEADLPKPALRFLAVSVQLDLQAELLRCLRHLRDAIRQAQRFGSHKQLQEHCAEIGLDWHTIAGDASYALSLADDLEHQQRL